MVFSRLAGAAAVLAATVLGFAGIGASVAVAAPTPALTIADLGTLGGNTSRALAVSGTIVVGRSDTASGDVHAFAYDLGAATPAMRDLGTLAGVDGLFSQASAVSGAIVVGYSDTASGGEDAFAYDLGAASPAMQDLAPSAAAPTARPWR